ncbi:hypothetical protein, partial [Rhodovulum sulfidophilum]|uniref:hypothetical protein n=1 Tax=Rhodovulum sulfidophilum TaxID=35806 RepID=UPI001F3AA72A
MSGASSDCRSGSVLFRFRFGDLARTDLTLTARLEADLAKTHDELEGRRNRRPSLGGGAGRA